MNAPQTPKGTFLVVADLFFFAKLQESLRYLGYEAIGAGNLEIARRRLREIPLRGVLLSLHKEGFDWRQFLKELRADPQTQGLPVLVFGSHVEVEAFREAEQLGADLTASNGEVAARFEYLLGNLLGEV
ncbi:MAG: hypothetical protein KatS3mg115_2332 [Candidatus Poribacteria bacterium]|nr:MAG: hypothetical protein KatS3mg115_2332 [Candidatus Poribacteria bacterium]